MERLFLQAGDDLAQEVVTVGEQFEQNLQAMLDTLFENRGNILWGLFLILLVLICSKLLLKAISALTGHLSLIHI